MEDKNRSDIDRTIEYYEKNAEEFVTSKVKPLQGKAGFLYLDKNGMPMVAMHWKKYFQHICEKYNSIYKMQMP